VFLLGFLLVADDRIYPTIARHWVWILCLGVVASVAYIWAEPRVGGWPEAGVRYVGIKFLYEVGVWGMILGLLGLGHRFMTVGGPVLAYATEAAYPFYILHQTVLVAVAYFVVQWSRPSGIKYAAIALASFALSLSLYEVAVRRWNPVRFLFGMKPKRKRTLAAVPAEHAVEPAAR
jgi:glucan biosynthesis protein C